MCPFFSGTFKVIGSCQKLGYLVISHILPRLKDLVFFRWSGMTFHHVLEGMISISEMKCLSWHWWNETSRKLKCDWPSQFINLVKVKSIHISYLQWYLTTLKWRYRDETALRLNCRKSWYFLYPQQVAKMDSEYAACVTDQGKKVYIYWEAFSFGPPWLFMRIQWMYNTT